MWREHGVMLEGRIERIEGDSAVVHSDDLGGMLVPLSALSRKTFDFDWERQRHDYEAFRRDYSEGLSELHQLLENLERFDGPALKQPDRLPAFFDEHDGTLYLSDDAMRYLDALHGRAGRAGGLKMEASSAEVDVERLKRISLPMAHSPRLAGGIRVVSALAQGLRAAAHHDRHVVIASTSWRLSEATWRHEHIHRQQAILEGTQPKYGYGAPHVDLPSLLQHPGARKLAEELVQSPLYGHLALALEDPNNHFYARSLAYEIGAHLADGEGTGHGLTESEVVDALQWYFDLLFARHGDKAIPLLEFADPYYSSKIRTDRAFSTRHQEGAAAIAEKMGIDQPEKLTRKIPTDDPHAPILLFTQKLGDGNTRFTVKAPTFSVYGTHASEPEAIQRALNSIRKHAESDAAQFGPRTRLGKRARAILASLDGANPAAAKPKKNPAKAHPSGFQAGQSIEYNLSPDGRLMRGVIDAIHGHKVYFSVNGRPGFERDIHDIRPVGEAHPLDDDNGSLFSSKESRDTAETAARDRDQLEGERLSAQLNSPLTRDEQRKKLKRLKMNPQTNLFEANDEPPQASLFDSRKAPGGEKRPEPERGLRVGQEVEWNAKQDGRLVRGVITAIEGNEVHLSIDGQTGFKRTVATVRPAAPVPAVNPVMEKPAEVMTGSLDKRIEQAMLKVQPRTREGAVAWLPDVRAELPDVSKREFDAKVLEMARADRLSVHDFREYLQISDREREDLVTDGKGRYFGGAAFLKPPQPNGGSVVLGSGLGALQPYFEKFMREDVTPTAKQLAELVSRSGDDLKKVFAPASRAGAQPAALSVRHRAAELQRSTDVARAVLAAASKYFDARPAAENFAFIDRVERGLKQPDPNLQKIADQMREILDSRRAAVQALGKGKLDQFIEDYFPHIWEQPDQARQAFQDAGKRPLEGSKAFLKKRTIETFADGLALGLKPVSTNPVDLVLAKAQQMDKYLCAHRILGDLSEQGLLRFKRANKPMPEGYTEIRDSVATVYGTPSHEGARQIEGHYIAPEPAARILNHYLSPGLREKSALFRAYLGLGNLMNQAQLSFSAFHLGTTTVNVAASKLSLAIYQGAHGDVLKGLKSLAQTPISPFTTLVRGDKMLKEWYAPGTQGARIGELIDAMVHAGGRAQMDAFYQTQCARQMAKAWRAGNVFGAMARLPGAAMEAAAYPIMQYVVPRQKLGVFADMAQYELERLGADASDPDVQAALARAWDAVDDRLGELVYDNLFWDKTVKDLAMASVRSVGWNLGTIRLMSGGLDDSRKLLGDSGRTVRMMIKGDEWGPDPRPDFTHRMAFIPSMFIVAGLLGATIYYLWHGHGPRHLKDYFFPTDSHGNRQSLWGYVKDFYEWGTDPLHTAQGKIHPLLTSFSEMLENKDFYGKPIMHRHDPLVKKAEELAEFAIKQFEPIPFRDRPRRPLSGPERTMRFLGIQPAPKSLDRHP